jgi:hypothetical protein
VDSALDYKKATLDKSDPDHVGSDITWDGVTLRPGDKEAEILSAAFKVDGDTTKSSIDIDAQICLRDGGAPFCCRTVTTHVRSKNVM